MNYLSNKISILLARNNFLYKLALHLIKIRINDSNDDFLSNGENFLVKYFCNYLKYEDVILDVGAHHGEWTNLWLKSQSRCTHYLIEPYKKNNAQIKKMLKNFSNHKYTIINCAVSNKNENTNFYVNNNEKFSGHNSIFDMNHIGYQASKKIITIEVKTIDQICFENNIKSIKFLKLDIEGSEFNALKGASKLLQKQLIDFIQLEFGHASRANRIYLHDIYAELNKHNYTMFQILSKGLKKLYFNPYLENTFSNVNLFFVKKSLIKEVENIIIN